MSVFRPFSISLLSMAVGIAFGQAYKHKNYDLVDVNYRVSFDVRREMVFGECTNTLVLDREASRVAFDFAKLNVGNVSVNGKPATFRWEGEMLWVNLPSGGKKGERLKIAIAYAGQPEAGLFFVPAARAYPSKTPMIYTQGEAEDTRYWLPTFDHPSDKATSEARIEVPRDWTAIGNGRLVGVSYHQTNKVFHWKMDQPHATYLNSIVAGPYVEATEKAWGTLPVSYFVPPGLEEEGRVAFAGTNEMIEFFSKLTGFKYPYAKFAQSTVSDYMFGGMENISAVTQTIATLHPAASEPLSSSKGLVLHELAHQWFGDVVTCEDWSHIWINEGFASFLPSFWVREHEGQDAFDLARYDTFQGALGAMAGEPRPMINEKYELPMDNFDGHAYAGGAARMYVLMEVLGEKVFWKAVKNYLNEYKYKSVTTDQFFASFSKSTGKDLTSFKKQWFYTPSMPKVTVSRTEKNYRIELPTESPFELDLPVWVWQKDKWLKSRIALSRPREMTNVDGLVLVDPEARIAMNVEYNVSYTDEEWQAMYQNMPNAAGKARIIDVLRAGRRQALLVQLVEGEKNATILPRLVNACASLPDTTCIALLNHPSPFVRQAAIAQAGRKIGNIGVSARLKTMLASETNPNLKLQIFGAIVAVTRNMAMVDEAWNTESWYDTFRAFALDTWFGTDRNKAREKCLEILAKPTSEPLRQNAIRKLGSLKDKPGERRVFDALIQVVQETSFGARNAAISSLGEYGDREAIPYLEPLTRHSLFFISRSAKSAVAKLRSS